MNRKNLRERARHRIDKFHLLLKSTRPTADTSALLEFNRYDKNSRTVYEEANLVVDSDDHYMFIDNNHCEYHEMIDCVLEYQIEENDDNHYSDDFDEVNEEYSLSENDDIQNQQLTKTRLHNYTKVSTLNYCEELSSFLRKANVNKSSSSVLLKLITSFLPMPNNVPSTISELLLLLNVENLFMKETIYISCKRYLNHQDSQCSSCQSLDEKAIARVYNIDL